MFEFVCSEDFSDRLKQLEKGLQVRIKEKLKFLSATENPLLFAKKIKGYKDIFRFRVGDFRIVFRRSKNTITLFFVEHRKDIYEGL